VSPNQNNPTKVDNIAAPSPQDPKSQGKEDKHADIKKNTVAKKKHVKKLSKYAVSRDTREYFTETLSMLISTGVTVGLSLEIISKEVPNKKVRNAILAIRDKVDEGGTLWKAIGESGILSASSVALIKAGEESGRLAENLKVVSDQTHRINTINAKVRSALIYPSFLIVLLILVGSGISLFLLPRLSEIFNGLDVELNLLTKIMINFGVFWSQWGLAITGLFFVALFFIGVGIAYSRPIRTIAENILFLIPGIKTLMYQTEISRLGFIMGSLLEAGLPIIDVLDSLSDSFSTNRYRKIALVIKSNVEEGQSIAKTFDKIKDRKALPGPIRQLIVSSEQSGNLSSTLLKISDIYEEKAEITAQNLETVLEPIILILIAVGVLFVALSVILPIYSLLGGIK
jgi:type IV pilus assembly protein PilC